MTFLEWYYIVLAVLAYIGVVAITLVTIWVTIEAARYREKLEAVHYFSWLASIISLPLLWIIPQCLIDTLKGA